MAASLSWVEHRGWIDPWSRRPPGALAHHRWGRRALGGLEAQSAGRRFLEKTRETLPLLRRAKTEKSTRRIYKLDIHIAACRRVYRSWFDKLTTTGLGFPLDMQGSIKFN